MTNGPVLNREASRAAVHRWCAVLAAIVVLTCAAAGPIAAAERPNIVLIVVDDLGYGELGCQGNRQIPTPHIDSLAADGVRMTAGYVTASYCSPSRAGLLTGRYQTRFGHEMNPVGRRNLEPQAGLPLSERTIADELRTAGYATGMVGKWHLGGAPEHHPRRRGFESFYGFLHEGRFFVPGPPWQGVVSFLRRKELPAGAEAGRWQEGNVTWSSHMGHNEPLYDDHNPMLQGERAIEESRHLTDAFTDEGVQFIEKHKRAPFFLYLAYNAVHSPLQAPADRVEQFAQIDDLHRRVFAALLAQLDDGVGRVLQKLSDERLDRNTLVILVSDNGGATRELTSSNAPLRGGKGDLYEGGIRVPFLVRWPERIPAGKTFDEAVIATDVMPTALAAAGVERPARALPLDGVDLLPHLRGEKATAPHETLYWRMGPKAALRHENWKLVCPSKGAPWELYDLATDREEAHDLAAAQPDVLRRLADRWHKLDDEMVPPLLPPAVPRAVR